MSSKAASLQSSVLHLVAIGQIIAPRGLGTLADLENARQPLGLRVGEDARVLVPSARVDPVVLVTAYISPRQALELDNVEACAGQEEDVDLIQTSVIVCEGDVRPCARERWPRAR